MPIKPILKVEQGLPQFLDGVEGPHPEQLFLQGPDEPLGHAVAFRRPHEAGARFDFQEAELLLEGMAQVLGTMVMAQDEAFGDALGQRAAVSPYPLVDRLQRLEMRSASGGGDAHHVTDEVVHGYERRGRSLPSGGDLGGVGIPHPVRALRDEGTVMDAGATDVAQSVRGLQTVFPHQAPHPFLRGGIPRYRNLAHTLR